MDVRDPTCIFVRAALRLKDRAKNRKGRCPAQRSNVRSRTSNLRAESSPRTPLLSGRWRKTYGARSRTCPHPPLLNGWMQEAGAPSRPRTPPTVRGRKWHTRSARGVVLALAVRGARVPHLGAWFGGRACPHCGARFEGWGALRAGAAPRSARGGQLVGSADCDAPRTTPLDRRVRASLYVEPCKGSSSSTVIRWSSAVSSTTSVLPFGGKSTTYSPACARGVTTQPASRSALS